MPYATTHCRRPLQDMQHQSASLFHLCLPGLLMSSTAPLFESTAQAAVQAIQAVPAVPMPRDCLTSVSQVCCYEWHCAAVCVACQQVAARLADVTLVVNTTCTQPHKKDSATISKTHSLHIAMQSMSSHKSDNRIEVLCKFLNVKGSPPLPGSESNMQSPVYTGKQFLSTHGQSTGTPGAATSCPVVLVHSSATTAPASAAS